ncbi:MAG: hypothetical protein QG671_3604 [Actinomycetota bacterium]|nr:hypothetical protein [Actinomycetota bacterium]
MDDIRQAQRRALAYWFVDGIPEAVGGGAIFLVGALLYLAEITGNDMFGSFSTMTMILAFPIAGRIVRTAKERITYPRTGYIKYTAPAGRHRTIKLVVAVLVAMGLAGFLASRPQDADGGAGGWLVTSLACGLGAAYGVRGWKTGVKRFYVVGAVLVILGAGIVLTGFGFEGAIGLLWMGFGVLSVVSGVLTLAGYLRENPPPEDEEITVAPDDLR